MNLTHPITSLIMYALHLYLAKREARKTSPVENRPMVICMLLYLLFGIIIYALMTFVSLTKSGNSVGLGLAMAFMVTIDQPLIWSIPNVVSKSKFNNMYSSFVQKYNYSSHTPSTRKQPRPKSSAFSISYSCR